MQLIATKRPAAEKYDRLNFVRDDGSSAAIDMPRQGILPHDLLHYLLETGLGLCGGFLSLVAAGQDARYVMELVHAPDRRDILRGHPAQRLRRSGLRSYRLAIGARRADVNENPFGTTLSRTIRALSCPCFARGPASSPV